MALSATGEGGLALVGQLIYAGGEAGVKFFKDKYFKDKYLDRKPKRNNPPGSSNQPATTKVAHTSQAMRPHQNAPSTFSAISTAPNVAGNPFENPVGRSSTGSRSSLDLQRSSRGVSAARTGSNAACSQSTDHPVTIRRAGQQAAVHHYHSGAPASGIVPRQVVSQTSGFRDKVKRYLPNIDRQTGHYERLGK
ncbi:hypothetical protein P389DRAFT_172018 [Cystobasidium minutum MCA 4210]|uniref:uncharacterized protein n=1 Tax=Cystobasidium minutum MCA 4210 TaxID=1397322 RepID=UPI0034CE0632|eukprot:jgi/Rhomi1/172018/fgenesh1_kg.4_\